MIRNIVAFLLAVLLGLTGHKLQSYFGNDSGFYVWLFVFTGVFPLLVCITARNYTILFALVPNLVLFITGAFLYPINFRDFQDYIVASFYFILISPLPILVGLLSVVIKGNLGKRLEAN